jgi:2'-5' RNA ligase
VVQSVELLFDEQTEEALRLAWQTLHAAGLPSLATNHSDSNRPHVTVAVAETGLEGAVEALRAVLARELASPGLVATLGGYVLFGGYRHRFVLARGLVLSRQLQALHSAVHQAVAVAASVTGVPDNVRPDAWTPHATLARRVPADRLGPALDLLDASTITGRFTGARLWDSGPRTITTLVAAPDAPVLAGTSHSEEP